MTLRLAVLVRHAVAAADQFIPADLPPDVIPRARHLITASYIAVLLLPVFASILFYLGDTVAACCNLFMFLMSLAIPPVLKSSGSVALVQKTFFGAVFILLMFLSYRTGGIASPLLAWLLLLPMVATLIGDRRSGLCWAVIALAGVAAIYALPSLGLTLPSPRIQNMVRLQGVSIFMLIITVATFSVIFGTMNSQAIAHLNDALSTIEAIASRDELTGLYNRRHLLKAIEEARVTAKRSGLPFCLCLMDLDHFKGLNDAFGHEAGDAVLRRFAEALQTEVRKTDCVGRYGGEEFLMLIPGIDIIAAHSLVERIRKNIEGLAFSSMPKEWQLTASFGLAQYQFPERIEQTIGRADRAMYQAKQSGRNQVWTAA